MGVKAWPHQPHTKVAEERAAVKTYREFVEWLKRDRSWRPACPVPGCTRKTQRRGLRVRKDVRDSTGASLGPLEVPRFCCSEHGWVPTNAWCMLPYVRTVALAVEDAVEQFVEAGHPASEAAGRSVEGERSVRRLVARLGDLGVQAWVQRMLDGLRPEQVLPRDPPGGARASLWATLARLRLLAQALQERNFALSSPLSLLWSPPGHRYAL